MDLHEVHIAFTENCDIDNGVESARVHFCQCLRACMLCEQSQYLLRDGNALRMKDSCAG